MPASAGVQLTNEVFMKVRGLDPNGRTFDDIVKNPNAEVIAAQQKLKDLIRPKVQHPCWSQPQARFIRN